MTDQRIEFCDVVMAKINEDSNFLSKFFIAEISDCPVDECSSG